MKYVEFTQASGYQPRHQQGWSPYETGEVRSYFCIDHTGDGDLDLVIAEVANTLLALVSQYGNPDYQECGWNYLVEKQQPRYADTYKLNILVDEDDGSESPELMSQGEDDYPSVFVEISFMHVADAIAFKFCRC